jgi:hypothetical protein
MRPLRLRATIETNELQGCTVSLWILPSPLPRHCRNGAVKNSIQRERKGSASAECLDSTRTLLPLTWLYPLAATKLFVPTASKRCAACARWFCLQNSILRSVQIEYSAIRHDCKPGLKKICFSALTPYSRALFIVQRARLTIETS